MGSATSGTQTHVSNHSLTSVSAHFKLPMRPSKHSLTHARQPEYVLNDAINTPSPILQLRQRTKGIGFLGFHPLLLACI